MSTVAWDGKSLAADGMASAGYMKVVAPKIWSHDGLVLATTGDAAAGRIMVEWFNAGADLSHYPDCQAKGEDYNATLIVAHHEGCYFYGANPHLVEVRDPFMAWGSGRDFAMGAMARGATAGEAVEVACRFDAYSGHGVVVMTPI